MSRSIQYKIQVAWAWNSFQLFCMLPNRSRWRWQCQWCSRWRWRVGTKCRVWWLCTSWRCYLNCFLNLSTGMWKPQLLRSDHRKSSFPLRGWWLGPEGWHCCCHIQRQWEERRQEWQFGRDREVLEIRKEELRSILCSWCDIMTNFDDVVLIKNLKFEQSDQIWYSWVISLKNVKY